MKTLNDVFKMVEERKQLMVRISKIDDELSTLLPVIEKKKKKYKWSLASRKRQSQIMKIIAARRKDGGV